MATQADLQHLSHEAPATERPGPGRFGAQSRRVAEDLRVLGSIALERTESGVRELRMRGMRALVRDRPVTWVLAALGLGLALGYVLYRP